MNCIIVDDEPLARDAIQLLVNEIPDLELAGTFGGAQAAAAFLESGKVDIVFLDIQMPGINGVEFARTISPNTLVIFTTAYAEYALDSYEVEAVDYLVKPVKQERFVKAVQKAFSLRRLMDAGDAQSKVTTNDNYFFIRSERKVFKVNFDEILLIEGLKDYVILHTCDQKIIAGMNIKTIYEQLPQQDFIRVSKSYIVNLPHIASFDNNSVYIRNFEVPIGNAYRNFFFDEVVSKRLFKR